MMLVLALVVAALPAMGSEHVAATAEAADPAEVAEAVASVPPALLLDLLASTPADPRDVPPGFLPPAPGVAATPEPEVSGGGIVGVYSGEDFGLVGAVILQLEGEGSGLRTPAPHSRWTDVHLVIYTVFENEDGAEDSLVLTPEELGTGASLDPLPGLGFPAFLYIPDPEEFGGLPTAMVFVRVGKVVVSSVSATAGTDQELVVRKATSLARFGVAHLARVAEAA